MSRLYNLTDEQFALLEPLLQEHRDPRGRKPQISDRHAIEGILYVLREGCRWRALPPEFGHWMQVFMRYKRWVERGVWWKILMRLQQARAVKVEITFLDSSLVRAHRRAEGGLKNRAFRR